MVILAPEHNKMDIYLYTLKLHWRELLFGVIPSSLMVYLLNVTPIVLEILLPAIPVFVTVVFAWRRNKRKEREEFEIRVINTIKRLTEVGIITEDMHADQKIEIAIRYINNINDTGK